MRAGGGRWEREHRGRCEQRRQLEIIQSGTREPRTLGDGREDSNQQGRPPDTDANQPDPVHRLVGAPTPGPGASTSRSWPRARFTAATRYVLHCLPPGVSCLSVASGRALCRVHYHPSCCWPGRPCTAAPVTRARRTPRGPNSETPRARAPTLASPARPRRPGNVSRRQQSTACASPGAPTRPGASGVRPPPPPHARGARLLRTPRHRQPHCI